jgi:hypothetical protein
VSFSPAAAFDLDSPLPRQAVAQPDIPLLLMLMQAGRLDIAASLITVATHGAAFEAAKNSLHAGKAEKFTTCEGRKGAEKRKNSLPNQRGVVVRVRVRVGGGELKKMLTSNGWHRWSSRVRLNSLLLLIAAAGEREKDGRFSFPQYLALSLSSPLPKSARRKRVPGEGLAVLAGLGVFVRERVGCSFPVRTASEFRFGDKFAGRPPFRVTLALTPARAEKWERRDERALEAYEYRHPEIAAVRESAKRVTFREDAAAEILRLHEYAKELAGPARRCFTSLNGGLFKVKADRMGTISTPIGGCPWIIRPFLLIDGEKVVEADISAAHLVALLTLYAPAFLKRLNLSFPPADVEREMQSLIAQLETEEIYGEGKKHKREMLVSLNVETWKQMAMEAAKRLMEGRPILREIMGAVKRWSHKDLAPHLLQFVAGIVNPSLLALHARGIPSIPIVDCLMVRERDAAAARNELGARIYEATGVCAKIGGVRYSPQLTGQALAA